jgi:hypothetical protein
MMRRPCLPFNPVAAPAETTESVSSPEPASNPSTTVPRPEAVSAEAGQEMKSPVAPGPGAEAVAPASPPPEPGQDWRRDLTGPPHERPNADAKPSIAENPAARADRGVTEKKTTHIRVAAMTRRPRSTANAVAARAADQNAGFAQSNPETAPPAQTQLVEGRAVTIRHANIASGRSRERSSAIGGPVVNAPGRWLRD